MNFRTLIAAVAAVILITGCDIGEDGDGGSGAAEGRPATVRTAPATTETRCDIGGQPDYYVPKPAEAPLAIIGCARLGLSMKPVAFTVNGERIDGEDYVCLNPAYRDTRRGAYIPNACVSDASARRFVVVDAEVPRQGVRGYRLVIWGTAAPSTRRVVAHYEEERTKAAVFTVRRPLTRVAGAARPFSIFVVELDAQVPACSVLLRAVGASGPSTTDLRGTALRKASAVEPRLVSCAK